MNNRKKILKYTLLIGVLFLFPLSLLLFFGVLTRHEFNTMPYLGPHKINPEQPEDTIYHRLPDFKLLNQEGEVYTLDSLQGKVWLAAFYATNAPYIKKVTARLLWPNFRYRHEDDILLVCFTLDADHDTPEVLKTYTEQMVKYHDYPGKWQFLTGDQLQIDQIIQKGFLLENPDSTAYMYLVDTYGHLRARYNANLEDHIKDAIEDIALLKKELDREEYELEKRTNTDSD